MKRERRAGAEGGRQGRAAGALRSAAAVAEAREEVRAFLRRVEAGGEEGTAEGGEGAQWVRTRVGAFLASLSDECDRAEAALATWTLSAHFPSGERVVLANVDARTTLAELRALLRAAGAPPPSTVRICRAADGTAIAEQDDSASICDLGVQDRDVLRLQLRNPTSSSSSSTKSAASAAAAAAPATTEGAACAADAPEDLNVALMRLLNRAQPAIAVSTAADAVALALHAFLVRMGFEHVAAAPSKVPGFAAPVRSVGTGRLVVAGWNATPSEVEFQYRHTGFRGKTFVLRCVQAENTLLVVLRERGARGEDGQMLEVDLPRHCADPSAVLTDGYSNLDELWARFDSFVNDVVGLRDDVREALDVAARAAEHSERGAATAPPSGVLPAGIAAPRVGPPPRHPEDDDDPLRVPPRGGGGGLPRRPGPTDPFPPSVGGEDLFPGGWVGPGFGGGAGGGGGSLVGPDHPMFGDGVGGPGGAPGFDDPRLPQPRFDPYGPVPGPNQPGVPDPGTAPGRGGGGRGGSRGRGGRGRGGRGRTPGEPDPDHLRVPGNDNNDSGGGGGGGGGGGSGNNMYT